MPTTLTKTARVLPLAELDADIASFSHADEYVQPEGDESRYGMAVTMHREVYDDLGSPSAITVTIEPGDRLNG